MDTPPVRILGINGSPFPNGTVATILDLLLSGAKELGAEVEHLHLYTKNISFTPGNYSEDPKKEVIEQMPEDDMKIELYEKIMAADGLVFATPCYWANMSGVMKNFIDRLTPLENQEFSLRGKVCSFIAASKENEGGVEMAVMSMVAALGQMGVLIPPNGMMWSPGDWIHAQESVPNWAKNDAPYVGKNMVRLIQLLKKENFRWL